MRKWAFEQLLFGSNGAYFPDRPITRAEFAALINRSFKLQNAAAIQFADIDETHWAYRDIAIAVQKDYIHGYADNTVRPNQPVTREEAAVMVAKLLQPETTDLNDLAPFKDSAAISSWSRSAVQTLVSKSIIAGSPEGLIVPQGKLTRAEAVTLLDKAIAAAAPSDTAYDKAGEYGPESGSMTIAGNVIVSAPDVRLRNLVIEGNLTIGKEVAEGDAWFEHVTVKGTTFVQGGGENSVHFADSVLVHVMVNKQDGTVRIVVTGNSSVQQVIINSPTKVDLAKESSIAELVLNAVAQLQGQGKVEKATVNDGGKGSSFETRPDEIGGEAASSVTAPSGGSGGGFGGGFGGGGGAGPIGGGTGGGTTGPGGSGGTGGDNGGTGGNGGDDDGNEYVPCLDESEACSDADITDIVLGDFVLNQLDDNLFPTGLTGMDPNVKNYSILTDRSMVEPVETITVTHSVYSRVNYTIIGPNGSYSKSGILKGSNRTLELKVDAMQDYWIILISSSGNSKVYKEHRLYIQYPRTLQEALKVGTTQFVTEEGGRLVANTVYGLQKGAINGIQIRSTDEVRLYDEGDSVPFLTCYSWCGIPEYKITGETGSWDVEIYRGLELLAAGTYRYDFTPVKVLPGDIGFSTRLSPLQDVQDWNERFGTDSLHAAARYELHLNASKLQAMVPEAKYYAYEIRDIGEVATELPEGLGRESFKLGILPFGYQETSPVSPVHASPIPFDVSVEDYLWNTLDFSLNYNAPDLKLVLDKFIFIRLYDKDYQIIGQNMIVVEFDDDHVVDGYHAADNWKPAP